MHKIGHGKKHKIPKSGKQLLLGMHIIGHVKKRERWIHDSSN